MNYYELLEQEKELIKKIEPLNTELFELRKLIKEAYIAHQSKNNMVGLKVSRPKWEGHGQSIIHKMMGSVRERDTIQKGQIVVFNSEEYKYAKIIGYFNPKDGDIVIASLTGKTIYQYDKSWNIDETLL